MASRVKILPKGHSRSQELQARPSLNQILLKSDTYLHYQGLQPNLVFECSILNIPWSKPQLKVNHEFSKKQNSCLRTKINFVLVDNKISYFTNYDMQIFTNYDKQISK